MLHGCEYEYRFVERNFDTHKDAVVYPRDGLSSWPKPGQRTGLTR